MAPNNALSKTQLGEGDGDGGSVAAAGQPTATAAPTPPVSAMPWDKWSPPYGPPLGAPHDPQIQAPEEVRGMVSRDEVRSRGTGLNEGTDRVESFLPREYRRFLTAAMFFTRLPCPPWVDHNPRHLVPGMVYFPAIGGIVGLWVWLWMTALAVFLPRNLAASGAVMLGTWITGCFHEDGLADTVDAFGGGWGKSEILRIMKDSRVGTYAVVVVSLYMFAKVSAIAALPDNLLLPVLVAGHCIGRWVILPMCYCVPYVAESEEENDKVVYNSYAACLNNGLLTATRVLVASTYVFVITIVGIGFTNAVIVMVGQLIFAILAGRYAIHVLDGVIGDYLGAAITVSELISYGLMLADFSLLSDGGWWPVVRLLMVAVPLYVIIAGAGELPKDRADKKKRKAKGC